MGEGKARKFGEEFIKLIKKYVEENEIERPDDFVVKSAPNKSAAKVAIIQSIDRRLALEDIAAARGMEMEELLGESTGREGLDMPTRKKRDVRMQPLRLTANKQKGQLALRL